MQPWSYEDVVSRHQLEVRMERDEIRRARPLGWRNGVRVRLGGLLISSGMMLAGPPREAPCEGC